MVLGFGLVGAAIGGWATAGTVLAAYGASIGWTLGTMFGQSLKGPQELPGVFGTRLSDLKVQTSTYGNAIPRAYGTIRVAGNVIYSADLVEHAATTVVSSGGKGGGGTEQAQTTYSYTVDFAVAILDGEIIGIRKVWANGTLLYTVANDASPGQVLASSQAMTIYTGSESQTADSTMVA